jgi:hypothetical protein
MPLMRRLPLALPLLIVAACSGGPILKPGPVGLGSDPDNYKKSLCADSPRPAPLARPVAYLLEDSEFQRGRNDANGFHRAAAGSGAPCYPLPRLAPPHLEMEIDQESHHPINLDADRQRSISKELDAKRITLQVEGVSDV